MTKEFYRYDSRVHDDPGSMGSYAAPTLTTLYLKRETPHGWWIDRSYGGVDLEHYTKEVQKEVRSQWKLIRKNAVRSYAYPTKKEALDSYMIRCEKRKQYLKRDLRHIDEVLVVIPRIYKKLTDEV